MFVFGEVVAGAPRFSTYATRAANSDPDRFIEGIPPAVIFCVGCCKTLVSATDVIFLLTLVKAGAMLVPMPATPWHAGHPC